MPGSHCHGPCLATFPSLWGRTMPHSRSLVPAHQPQISQTESGTEWVPGGLGLRERHRFL